MAAQTTWKDRANYTVARGQGSGAGEGWERALEVRGTAEDESVRTTRVSVVQLEGEPTSAECTARAQWEQAIRAARGSRVTVVVEGWTYGAEETLWRPGSLVPVWLPAIRVSGRLLIDAVQLREGAEGRTTQLSLVRPDAYLPQPTLTAGADPVGSSFGWGQS